MATESRSTRPKTTIEIPIPSIRRYVPGSGPLPPRITLAPPRDSTAYIIDQFVLPTESDTTKTSRRLIHYHIGFTDLPAVKILIPCHKVLDYVSPRELEDWEYQNAERREEERAREAAEKQRAAAKKAAQAQEGIPTPTVLSPADEALLLAKEVAGPSLSTPQKRKVALALAAENMGDTSSYESDDAAVQRQLYDDAGSESEGIEGDLDEELESVDQLAAPYDTSGVVTPSRAASSAPLPEHPFPTVVSMEAGFLSSGSGPSSIHSTSAPTPGQVHPAWAKAFGLPKQAEQPLSTPGQNGHAKQNGSQQKSNPKNDLNKPQDQWHSFKSQVPVHPARSRGGAARSSSRELTSGFSTPSAATKPPLPSESSASRLKGQEHKAPPKESSLKMGKKRKRPEFQDEPAVGEEAADGEWEIKELLDDGWVIEHGVNVHKYLVLWEGDWPEDQNPTWEPAENIQDQSLIRRYEKRKKAGLPKSSKKAQKTLHHFFSGPQYSSVAEAFEGGIDEQAGLDARGLDSDAEPPDEEFVVTENAGDLTRNGIQPSPSFRSFDSMLARYNQSFPRA
jgi:hypothetical protein